MHVKNILTVGALLSTVLEAAPMDGISKIPLCLKYSVLTPLANIASVRRSKWNLVNSFKHCLFPHSFPLRPIEQGIAAKLIRLRTINLCFDVLDPLSELHV